MPIGRNRQIYYRFMNFFKSFSKLSIHPCQCTKATDNGLTIFCENTNLASLSLALANLALEDAPIDDLLIKWSHFGT